MGKHVLPYNNNNQAIIGIHDETTPLCYFNCVHLKQGESYEHKLDEYESIAVLVAGSCDIQVADMYYKQIGKRARVWDGDPEGVYIPVGQLAKMSCITDSAEILIAGGQCEQSLKPFAIRADDIDMVQYGSDDTKTHRKIKHILGQKNAHQRGRLLVSELFTVGAGGWSGFPPHKHDTENLPEETRYEEVYQFRFNPEHGFGAQFLYEQEDDLGPVYHVRTGSVIAIDKGYHPSVSAPGYEMYYFTVIVGEQSKSLVQKFDPHHEYQVHTIPGIKDMIAKFK